MDAIIAVAVALAALAGPPEGPPTGCPSATGSSATVLVPASPDVATPAGALEAGDILSVHTAAAGCVGVATWQGHALAIALWADDPLTPGVDGFADGDGFSLHAYDASEGHTYRTGVSASFAAGFGVGGGLRTDGVYVVAGAPGAVYVSPLALSVSEAGGAAPFYVELSAPPSAEVYVAVSSSDAGRATVSPARLTFTPGGPLRLPVTVAGVDDGADAGDRQATVAVAAAASADGRFDGLDPDDVVVTVEGAGGAPAHVWISEVDAVGADPFIEVQSDRPDAPLPALWLVALDERGRAYASVDLSAHAAGPTGHLAFRPGSASFPTAQAFGTTAGAFVLSAVPPELGGAVSPGDVHDAVAYGAPGVGPDPSLAAAAGIQFVDAPGQSLGRPGSGGPQGRPGYGRLFYPSVPSPGAPNAAEVTLLGPGDGAGGHRIVSVPVVDEVGAPLSVGDLGDFGAFGPVVGVEGSASPRDAPNVWTDRDADGRFLPPSSVDVPIPPGRGVVWEWPETAEGAANGSAPSLRLSHQGLTVDDAVTGGPQAVTFPAPAPDGHYLVGNPYAYPLRLGGLSVEGGALQSALAVWDPADRTYVDLFVGPDAPAGSDALPVWGGAIAEVSSPTGGPVTFSTTSAAVDPTAVGGAGPGGAARLSFVLNGELSDGTPVADRSAHVRLVEGASDGWDPHDASKLLPPAGAYALVAPIGSRDGAPRRQRVLSSAPGRVPGFPLAFSSTDGGTFVLRWTTGADLSGLELVDHQVGAFVDLGSGDEYAFEAAGPTPWTERFEVRAAAPTAATPSELPPSPITVGVPYPNPAVDATTVFVRAGASGGVQAVVFDVVGRRVVPPAVRPVSGGAEIRIDTRALAPGLYVVRVDVGGAVETRRFSVVR